MEVLGSQDGTVEVWEFGGSWVVPAHSIRGRAKIGRREDSSNRHRISSLLLSPHPERREQGPQVGTPRLAPAFSTISHSLTCSARIPKQYNFRNFLMSEECADMARMAANLA